MFYFFKKIFPQRWKNIYHFFQAVLANLFFRFPSSKIKIIGVTGTNGKTTTCQMIDHILGKVGKKTALASTINFKMGEKQWVNKTKFTTLSAWAVQKFIAQAVKEKCDFLILETSSHSLDQYRVWGVKYFIAVITNITREHLDYHQTMEEYKNAKLKLFKKVPVGVINLNMDWAEEFLDSALNEKWGYFIEKQKNGMEKDSKNLKIIKAEELELGQNFSKFKVNEVQFELQLLGDFNVENALAGICTGLACGVDLKTIAVALGEIEKVTGRMDEVKNELGIRIFIDYALTPDSMEKLGQLAQGLKEKNGKIIWVFGSCGERDQGKRPIMGEIGSRFSDWVIITNEDPFFEDPQKIIDEVFAGVLSDKNKKRIENENCWRIFDRQKAIQKALSLAEKGDLILITGKGAEETMAMGRERINWNDRQVVEEEIANIVYSNSF